MLMWRCSAFREGVVRSGRSLRNVESDFLKDFEIGATSMTPQRRDGLLRRVLRRDGVARARSDAQQAPGARKGTRGAVAGAPDDRSCVQGSAGQRGLGGRAAIGAFDRLENRLPDETSDLQSPGGICDVAGKSAKGYGIEGVAGIEALAEAPTRDRCGRLVGQLVVEQHESVEEIEGRCYRQRIRQVLVMRGTGPQYQSGAIRIANVWAGQALVDDSACHGGK
jgi:hypothetical protein